MVPELRRRIQVVFRDIWSWQASGWAGTLWQADHNLLRLLSVWYVTAERIMIPDVHGNLSEQDNRFMLPDDLDPDDLDAWNGSLYPVTDFIEQHRKEIYLLVQDYRQHIHLPDPGSRPGSSIV